MDVTHLLPWQVSCFPPVLCYLIVVWTASHSPSLLHAPPYPSQSFPHHSVHVPFPILRSPSWRSLRAEPYCDDLPLQASEGTWRRMGSIQCQHHVFSFETPLGKSKGRMLMRVCKTENKDISAARNLGAAMPYDAFAALNICCTGGSWRQGAQDRHRLAEATGTRSV